MSSLVAQTVENLPEMQEIRVQPLGWEDPLEKRIATHSIILSRRIPGTKETSRLLWEGENPGCSGGAAVGYSPWGCKEWDTTERLTLSFSL